MPSSGKWRRVGLVRTDVSEEIIASIFMVEQIRQRKKSVSSWITADSLPQVTTSKKTAFFMVFVIWNIS
jgi:hypothetical protein